MTYEFVQLDVFTTGPFTGNPVAVFFDAKTLSAEQMQTIASEMNLSETTFVREVTEDSYSVRIFTPTSELPFAGHPTIGAAYALSATGRVSSTKLVQHSKAGETPVEADGDRWFLTRPGTVDDDLEDRRPDAPAELARALGIAVEDLGLEARELGRSGRLRPAVANSAFEQLLVPVRDVDVLARCRPRPGFDEIDRTGAYCFTATRAGRVQARGFWPGLGIAEDPATGSAAAGLGLYLADRLGPIDFEIDQGVEMKRPSHLLVDGSEGTVRIGGRCEPIFSSKLEQLP